MAERPDRVSIPGILSEHASRLRALERSRPGFVPPKGDDFIELWDEGVPQGLVRALDFVGSGVQVETTGDERGLVNIAGGGGAGGWDAIVDGTAVASDPDARLFLGIGEALTYLATTVGLTSCVIAVRPFDNLAAGDGYVETANWSMPDKTQIIGLRTTAPFSTFAVEAQTPAWDWNGWRPSVAPSALYVEGFNVFKPSSMANGGVVDNPLGVVIAKETWFDFSGFPQGSNRRFCTSFIGEVCTFDWPNAGAVTWRFSSGNCIMLQCDVNVRAQANNVWIPAGGSTFIAKECRLFVNGSITLPTTFDVENLANVGSRFPGSVNGISTYTLPSGATVAGRIFNADGLWQVAATSTFGSLTLGGSFGSITTTGTHSALVVIASCDRTSAIWDLRGPASVNAVFTNGATLRLRGEGVVGQVAGDTLTGSSGTIVDFVGADDCVITAALDGTGTTGTTKPYAFDATSDNNVLVITNLASFPAAGTNAGTNNRILPEGAAAFTINGHVIEDEGVALTQRANMNFVGSGVTATDAGGKTVVTIPGGTVNFDNPVESQFGDVMSQGVDADSARADHKHDRHDDAVLYLTRMI